VAPAAATGDVTVEPPVTCECSSSDESPPAVASGAALLCCLAKGVVGADAAVGELSTDTELEVERVNTARAAEANADSPLPVGVVDTAEAGEAEDAEVEAEAAEEGLSIPARLCACKMRCASRVSAKTIAFVEIWFLRAVTSFANFN
jgi:hypothetical protein